MSEAPTVRVQKFLSDAGISSRRGAEMMIRSQEVTINGKTAQLGDKIIPGKDHVKVRGKLIVKVPKKIAILEIKKIRSIIPPNIRCYCLSHIIISVPPIFIMVQR